MNNPKCRHILTYFSELFKTRNELVLYNYFDLLYGNFKCLFPSSFLIKIDNIT